MPAGRRHEREPARKGGPSPRLGRRELLRGAALTAAGAAGAAAAQEGALPPVSDPQVAAAADLAGRRFTPAERQAVVRRLQGRRPGVAAMRARSLDPRDEPAVRFDPVLPGRTGPPAGSELRPSRGRAPAYSGDPESLAHATVVELGRLLRAKKVTSAALTRMFLDRLRRFGPRLNCVVTLLEEPALQRAAEMDREIRGGKYRGPLHGIPWGAKDLLAVRGAPTTWGISPYRDRTFDYDATVVERLDAAGAVLVAKLSLGELALGDVWFGGRTRNPWDSSRGSSGSSAGSGCAVAAGLVGFAIGSETLGSIVSPSVENGVIGLRPTFGRVSRYGAMTLSWSMDKIGPMCRGVEDCALVLHAIQGPDGRDWTVVPASFRWRAGRPLDEIRVGIDAGAFAAAERDARRAPFYRLAREKLEGLGLVLHPVRLPPQRAEYRLLAGITIDVESAASFEELMESGRLGELVQQGDGNWPNTFRSGSLIPAVDYLRALRLRRRLQEEMAGVFREVDLYVTVPFSGPGLAYTNLTGHPALIARCGVDGRRPLSIEFVGNLFAEAEMLRTALAFERAMGRAAWPDPAALPETPP